jgi:hypothetical protein
LSFAEIQTQIKTSWDQYHLGPEQALLERQQALQARQQALQLQEQAMQAKVSHLERVLRENNIDPDVDVKP